MKTPTLKTRRMTLRAPRASDVDALAAHYADPAHFDSLGDRAPTAEQAHARATIFVVEAANFWAALGYGPFVARTKTRWIGLCGFRPPPEEVALEDAHPLLVFGVDRAVSGRGYASEAAQAAMTWIHGALNGPRVDAATRPDNAAAAAVLKKLGFEGPRPGRLYGAELSVFSRPGGSVGGAPAR